MHPSCLILLGAAPLLAVLAGEPFVDEPPVSPRAAALGRAVAAIPSGAGSLYENWAGLGPQGVGSQVVLLYYSTVLSGLEAIDTGASFCTIAARWSPGATGASAIHAGYTFRPEPDEAALRDFMGHDLRRRLQMDYDDDGEIDPTLDNVGPRLDTVAVIRGQYEQFVHCVRRGTVAYTQRFGRTERLLQAVGLRADCRYFEPEAILVSLDVAWWARCAHRPWSICATTSNLMQAQGGSKSSHYAPYEDYLWREVSVGGAYWTPSLAVKRLHVVSGTLAGVVTLRFRDATMVRDAVLEGGTTAGEGQICGGVSAEVLLLNALVPRIGVDFGYYVKQFRLTAGLGLRLRGHASVDCAVYQERGGPEDGYVFVVGAQLTDALHWQRRGLAW